MLLSSVTPFTRTKNYSPRRPTGLPQQITFFISFIFVFSMYDNMSHPNELFPLASDFEKYGLNGSH